jgi:hypothetical protein
VTIGRIADFDIVLLDAMIINNFAEAGAHRPLVEYLGAKLATTTVVAEESSDDRHVTEPRRFILRAIETGGHLIAPTLAEGRRIELMATPAVPGGRIRDRGEASLVVCATAMAQSKVIVLDDRGGRGLAQSNRIAATTGRRRPAVLSRA